MKYYLVGGAVRDMLLGILPKDIDWAVTGATEKEMIKNGFLRISFKFPVFIDPKSKEEYALARLEKKTINGIEVIFSEKITLNDDLKRRDLTINAIAIDKNNNIIDPFNGQRDLYNRILRHISESFIYDPLRIIRLARFKAQLSYFNFLISKETINLIQNIEIYKFNNLKREQLNKEFIKSLNNPIIFFNYLNKLNILKILFPNINKNLSYIPNEYYFKNYVYQNSSIDEQIVLCFLKIPIDEINNIKNDLLLTNNQYKILKASLNINKILRDKNINAQDILFLIKNANIIRDEYLFNISLSIYKKYEIIDPFNDLFRNYKLLKIIINKIRNINFHNLVNTISTDNIKNILNDIYINIIKVYFDV